MKKGFEFFFQKLQVIPHINSKKKRIFKYFFNKQSHLQAAISKDTTEIISECFTVDSELLFLNRQGGSAAANEMDAKITNSEKY